MSNITIADELGFDLSDVVELRTLDQDDRKVFHHYLSSRPLDQWRYTDMPMLVQVIKIIKRADRIFERIEIEGYMLPGSTGESLVANPLFRIYTTLLAAHGTLVTRLQLTPLARGESTSTAPMARLVDSNTPDYLIPRDIGE